jgi:hypothetical protein
MPFYYWSFASGKTPVVIAATRQLLNPQTLLTGIAPLVLFSQSYYIITRAALSKRVHGLCSMDYVRSMD